MSGANLFTRGTSTVEIFFFIRFPKLLIFRKTHCIVLDLKDLCWDFTETSPLREMFRSHQQTGENILPSCKACRFGTPSVSTTRPTAAHISLAKAG